MPVIKLREGQEDAFRRAVFSGSPIQSRRAVAGWSGGFVVLRRGRKGAEPAVKRVPPIPDIPNFAISNINELRLIPVISINMNMTKAEGKFETYREYLLREAERLFTYICVYKQLHERQKDRLEIINISPAFFQTVIDSLFSSIVIWVDKLFCEKSERGLFNFLTFCEHNRKILEISELKRRRNYPDGHWMLNRESITYASIQTDKEKLKNIESLPSFKLRRDKFHAHFDKEYFFDRKKIGETAPLRWKDLDQIIDVTKETINKYSAAYDGNLHALIPVNIKDLDNILDLIFRLKNKGSR